MYQNKFLSSDSFDNLVSDSVDYVTMPCNWVVLEVRLDMVEVALQAIPHFDIKKALEAVAADEQVSDLEPSILVAFHLTKQATFLSLDSVIASGYHFDSLKPSQVTFVA